MSRKLSHAGRMGGLLVIALAAGSLAGAPAYGVSAGTRAAEGSYPFVAHLDIGGVRRCSGALIAPGWVATSRNCFPENTASGPPARTTTVTVGRSDLESTGGRVRTVTDLVRHPDRDLALARLNAPIPDIAPIKISSAPPATGDVLRAGGYGRTATAWLPGRLSTASFAVQDVTAGTVAIAEIDSSGAAICKGDAGGPAFRESTDGMELVGLNSAAWQKGCLGESETRQGATETRLDNITDWITANTPRLSFGNVAVPNYGFENGLSGWTPYGAGSTTASTDRAYEGAAAGKIVDSSTTTSSGLSSADLPVMAGVSYSAFAWVYAESGRPTMHLNFYDRSGKLLSEPYGAYTAGTGRWAPLEVTATAPPGATRLSVRAYSSVANVGTAYFDQMMVRQAAELPVLNPSFESGLSGWTQYGAGVNTASSGRAYSGSGSAKIVDSSATSSSGLSSTDLPAVAGIAYRAFAWVYAESGRPSMHLNFYDSAGKLLSEPYAVNTAGTGRWAPLDVTASAPVGATRMSVRVYSSVANVGTAYFDQVMLWRAAEMPVLNPSFENGLSGWTQYGAGGNTASAERTHEGAAAVKIIDPSATDSSGLQSAGSPVTSGVSYTASAWVYAESGVPSMHLHFYDDSGARIGNTSAMYTGGTGQWAPLRVTETAPHNASRVVVIVYSSISNVGTAYFDQIMIQ